MSVYMYYMKLCMHPIKRGASNVGHDYHSIYSLGVKQVKYAKSARRGWSHIKCNLDIGQHPNVVKSIVGMRTKPSLAANNNSVGTMNEHISERRGRQRRPAPSHYAPPLITATIGRYLAIYKRGSTCSTLVLRRVY